jgi:hypothetical protein
LIGVFAAMLGFAGTPAVGYSAGAKKHQAHCAAKSCKLRAKSKCKVGQPRTTGKCVKRKTSASSRTPSSPTTPEALSATLIVHVYKAGGSATEADEEAPLHISKLRTGQFLGKLDTSEHTVHVTPGEYEVTALDITNPTTVALASTRVWVSAGQTQEVALTVS